MALIRENYGCKVGWQTFDNEAEAKAASEQAKKEAIRKAGLGYDFGYCVPGNITHRVDEDGERWTVTIP